MRVPESVAEARYRDGVAAWIQRDLVGALMVLGEALELARHDPDDRWSPAIERAMAQIAMEQDDLGRAAWHLRRFTAEDVDVAQQLALRAKRDLLAGEPDGAVRQAAAALWLVRDAEPVDDLGWLMNGAIALAWTADVLVELGFAADALTATSLAHDRTARAGHFDAAVETMCALAEAGAHRLLHDAAAARDAMRRVDPGLDVDIPIQLQRLEARLCHDAGDQDEAQRRYEAALRACEGTGHESLARCIREELAEGPPRQRAEPLESWIAAHGMDLPSGAGAYALVLHVPLGDLEACFALGTAVASALEGRPELGEVDGDGTDGTVWDLYLEGPDPAALLDLVRPLVDAAGLAAGATATLRASSGGTTVRLG